MAQSTVRTGPNMVLKIANEDGSEKTIGFVDAVNFQVINGQKEIMTVDSPFPQEIAQGASASMVRGDMRIYMLKGTDPVRSGLVAPHVENFYDNPAQARSRYINIRLYDRFSGETAFILNWVKVSNWSVNIQAKSIVRGSLSFTGILYQSGSS